VVALANAMGCELAAMRLPIDLITATLLERHLQTLQAQSLEVIVHI